MFSGLPGGSNGGKGRATNFHLVVIVVASSILASGIYYMFSYMANEFILNK